MYHIHKKNSTTVAETARTSATGMIAIALQEWGRKVVFHTKDLVNVDYLCGRNATKSFGERTVDED